jgi:hypothetical protein
MSVTEKTQIGIIDLTPTWEQQARNCVAILKDSHNSQAIEAAETELIRMACLLDRIKEQHSAGQLKPVEMDHSVPQNFRG